MSRQNDKIQKISLAEDLVFSKKKLETVLRRFQADGLLNASERTIQVSPVQRVKLGIAAIQFGCGLEHVGHLLSWQDFEGFIEFALQQNGYTTWRHVILIKPRKEIDLVAISSSLILAIDCKHWTIGGKQSELSRVALEQSERTRRLVSEDRLYQFIRIAQRPNLALPVVVTLLESPNNLISGVPIVPVHKLQSFLDEVERYIHQFRTFNTRKLLN